MFQKHHAFDNLSGSFDNFNPAPKRGTQLFDNLRWVVTLTTVKFLGGQKWKKRIKNVQKFSQNKQKG